MPSRMDSSKFALVSGGAHRVGKVIAQHLAQMGFNIGIHYGHSEAEAAQTRREIEANGRTAELYCADLQDPEAIEKMFSEIAKKRQAIDVLVNSAAIMPRSDLLQIDWQAWDHMLNVNLRAPWLVSVQAARLMRNGGLILNISDAGAGLHWTGYGAYAISKQGLNELTCLLAKQLAPKIRVCGIAPGLLLKPEAMPEVEWAKLAAKVPMQSAGDMASLLATIDLLITNGYITGETITLNGGASLG